MSLDEKNTLVWRKSSRSGGSGAQCVELAATAHSAYVRDTKNRTGGTLVFPAGPFAAFLTDIKAGRQQRP